MNLQELNDAIVAKLTELGLTEIEIELKPKNQPNSHTKIFISCETKQTSNS